MRIKILFVLLTLIFIANAARIYVDPVSGSDANAGNDSTAAFAHAASFDPANATGTAAATSPLDGDSLIIKGGTRYSGWIGATDTGVTLISGHLLDMPWGTTPCTLSSEVTYARTVWIQDTTVRFTLKGLVVQNRASPTTAVAIQINGDSSSIEDCIIDSVNANGLFVLGAIGSAVINSRFTRCADGINSSSVGGVFSVKYCTVVNNRATGILSKDFNQLVVKNTYSGGNTTADYGVSNSGTFAFATSYSSDGSQSTTSAAYSSSSGAYFIDVTPGAEDLHIGNASSSLIGNGTDISGDATWPVTVDVDGGARGTPPDIGYDEYVAGTVSIQLDSMMRASIRLSNRDTIYWIDTLTLKATTENLTSFDSLRIGDSLCTIISQSTDSVLFVTDSGMSEQLVVVRVYFDSDSADLADTLLLVASKVAPDSSTITDTTWTIASGGVKSITITPYPKQEAGSDFTVTVDTLFGSLVDSAVLTWSVSSPQTLTWPTFTFQAIGSETVSIEFFISSHIPVVDSLRPNPNYTNDSSSVYLSNGGTSGTMRNIELDEAIVPYFWSDARIDYKTGVAWPRGTYSLEITNDLGFKDTTRLRIVLPRSK